MAKQVHRKSCRSVWPNRMGGHGPDLAPLDPPLSVEHPISSLLLTMQWKLASLQYCVIQYTREECNLFLKHGTRSRLMEIVENVSSGTYGMIQWWKSLPLLLTKLCLRVYDASGQSCLMQHSPNVYLRSMQSRPPYTTAVWSDLTFFLSGRCSACTLLRLLYLRHWLTLHHLL